MASRSSAKRVRAYTSALRRSQADATRRAVLSAARDVFTRLGYGAATIEAVAEAARVSVPTVYAGFSSKAGLLSAVVADGGSDADIRRMAEKAIAETSPRARIAAAARVVRTIMQREKGVLDLLHEAGAARPELEAMRRQVHRQQREALARVLRPLHEAGALRAGVGLDEGAAGFSALASPECYRLFVSELGWSATRWEKWLAESAVRLLLD